MNIVLGIILVCAGAAAARAQFVANPSFESNLAGWNVPSTNLGVRYAIATGGVDGVRHAVVSNRVYVTDSPRQNITAALGLATNGNRYATRVWVNVAATASVRAVVQFYDGPSLRRVVMAERMVLETNRWTELRGVQTIAWTGALANAFFLLEVGLPVESNFPAFALDGISLLPDSDGDGLADAVETNTSPQSADSDGDGLPDAWEHDHAFSNGVNEAGADVDGDGFTNLAEYRAATRPRDRWSFPGRPSNPNASAAARAVLDYLALMPTGDARRVLMGQHCSYPTNEFTNYVVRLEQMTGHAPALLSLQYDDQAFPLAVPISNANAYARAWWTNGGVVLIKWQPRNPWTRGQPQATNHGPVDLTALIDPTNGPPAAFATNLMAHTNYMGWLREVADGLEALRSNGVVVLWRPMSEMNGAWFWHGHENRGGWIGIWRHMHRYFSVDRGLNHLLWVYEADSGVHGLLPSDYYYPGDEVVDVLGHNLYDDDWKLDDDLQELYREHGKVYGIPQAGPAETRDGTWSNTVMIAGITQALRRCSFIGVWNSFSTNGTPVHMAIADNRQAQELMDHPWSVDLAHVAWTNHLQPGRVAIEGGTNRPLVGWRGGFLQQAAGLADWADVPVPSFPHLPTNAPSSFFRVRD